MRGRIVGAPTILLSLRSRMGCRYHEVARSRLPAVLMDAAPVPALVEMSSLHLLPLPWLPKIAYPTPPLLKTSSSGRRDQYTPPVSVSPLCRPACLSTDIDSPAPHVFSI